MSKYTPTFDDVAVAYRLNALGYTDHPADAPHDPEETATVDAEFERYIAQVRRESAVEALREAAVDLQDSKYANSVKTIHDRITVPESAWLIRRADQIEGGEL